MRENMKYIAIALLPILVAACSSQPKQSTQTPPPVAGTAALVAPDATITPERKAYLAKKGYRVVQRQGKVVYCRTGASTGSLFRSETCLTEAQLEQEERGAREMGDWLRRNCALPQCS